MATSLKEITLDNNPISLGGDCISFLVSYLPNLLFLSQMQVTDQVVHLNHNRVLWIMFFIDFFSYKIQGATSCNGVAAQ